jgi:hypothetical protein
MSVQAIFQPFYEATKSAFAYLAEQGFICRDEANAGAEAWVTYENGKTRITVHYELGAVPWVEVGRLESRGGRFVQPQSVSLDLLLRDRGVSLKDEISAPREITPFELSSMLGTRAERLRQYGADVLRGDFSSFPRLQTKAEKELRRREAETIRFEG